MTKILKVLSILSVASLICFAQVKPNSITKDIVELDERGEGKKVGTVTVTETADGISIEVKAAGLTAQAGQVGFHLHEKNSTRPTKDASGKTVVGGGLGADIGDLGSLTVNADGSVNQTVSSANIKYSDLKGKSLVIYANADATATGGSDTVIYAAAIF